MRNLVLCWLLFSVGLSAAVIRGTIVDPSGALVGEAQVSVVTPLGWWKRSPLPTARLK